MIATSLCYYLYRSRSSFIGWVAANQYNFKLRMLILEPTTPCLIEPIIRYLLQCDTCWFQGFWRGKSPLLHVKHSVNGSPSACSLSALITVIIICNICAWASFLTMAFLFYSVRRYAAQPGFHWHRIPIAQSCVHPFLNLKSRPNNINPKSMSTATLPCLFIPLLSRRSFLFV